MKALLIEPASQSIQAIEISDLDAIVAEIGYDTLIADEVGESGDKLYFDEECFLRGTEGRFQIDSLIPVSGKGIVIGSSGETLTDHQISMDDLKARIKFL